MNTPNNPNAATPDSVAEPPRPGLTQPAPPQPPQPGRLISQSPAQTLGQRLTGRPATPAQPPAAPQGQGPSAEPSQAIDNSSANEVHHPAHGDGDNIKPRPPGIFPIVENDKIFPMTAFEFLRDVKHILIEYRKGGLWTEPNEFISRTISQSSDYVNVMWSMPGKNGQTSFHINSIVDNRLYNSTKTQLTIDGAGGCIFIEGDKIKFVMKDGTEYNMQQWRKWKEGKV